MRSQNRIIDESRYNNRAYNDAFENLNTQCMKNEQYTRRDTVTVVGLDMPNGEAQADLSAKVAEHLSNSGESVAHSDFSVVHRNAANSKEVRGKVVPPSVTVRFLNISKKDRVLRSYSNFDQAKKQVRPVRVYQSLCKRYADVCMKIVNFFKLKADDDNMGILNCGLTLKWCTYSSPSAGFALKLSDGQYFTGVHTFRDFAKLFISKYEAALLK